MTVCEKCGTARKAIPDECPACHFRPATLRELATAALLTTAFEAGEESYGTPQSTLDAMAGEIRAGRGLKLDTAELARHKKAVKAFLSVSTKHLVWVFVDLFGPAVLFLAGLLALGLILRAVFR